MNIFSCTSSLVIYLINSSANSVFSSLILLEIASPPPADAIAIFPGNNEGSTESTSDASTPLAFHTPLNRTPTFPFVLKSAIKFPLSSVV